MQHSVFDQGRNGAIHGCHIGRLFVFRHGLNQALMNIGNREVAVHGLQDRDNCDTSMSATQSVRTQQLGYRIASCGTVGQLAGILRGSRFRQYSVPFAST